MKKSSIIILGIIIVLLIAVIGVGGLYIVKINQDSNKKIEDLESKIGEMKNEVQPSDKNQTENVLKNEVINSDDTSVNNKNEANQAIKKGLKDDSWLEKNIFEKYKNYYMEQYKENWLTKTKENTRFEKMKNIDGNPVYIVKHNVPWAGEHAWIIMYVNSSIKVIEVPTFDYSTVKVDVERNVILTEADATGEQRAFIIENGNTKQFAEAKLNKNDNVLYYYVNEQNVSYGKYKGYIEDCKDITIKLTDSNIDYYLK